MGSEAAKGVAREVLETIGRGEIPSVTKIAPKHGYSKATAKSGEIQQTKSYKAELKPLIDQLEEERQAIIKRLKVTRNKAKYRDLIDGMDKVTKNIQLLSGGATHDVKITWE